MATFTVAKILARPEETENLDEIPPPPPPPEKTQDLEAESAPTIKHEDESGAPVASQPTTDAKSSVQTGTSS